MYYTVYKITNLINGKIYIGCHQTDDLNDGYMGSGKVLKRAIKKYGLENFQKEILQVFESPEKMFEMESVLVNKEFVKRPDTYNLKEGRFGGWNYENSNSEKQRRKGLKGNEKMKVLRETDFEWKKKKSGKISERLKDQYREGIRKGFKGNEFLGKHHIQEAKEKMGKANAIHQKGEGNSQFGTCWIHNPDLKENKKIKKDQLENFLPEGWVLGRKMK